MSKGAATFLAIAMILAGTGCLLFGLSVRQEVPRGSLHFYGLAAGFFLVAAACLYRRTRPFVVPAIVIGWLAFTLWSAGPVSTTRLLTSVGFVIGAGLMIVVACLLYSRW